jgi:hypothetical protein
MRFYWLLLGALAVWRITHLLANEDGPWDLILRLRTAVGSGFWGQMMDCFNCLSLWVALPFAFGMADGWREGLLLFTGFARGAANSSARKSRIL